MESYNFGGQVSVNHKDGQHRIHLNGLGDRSEISFSGHKPAKLEAHNQRLALRSKNLALFNSDHHRLVTLHHNCPLDAGGHGHVYKTNC